MPPSPHPPLPTPVLPTDPVARHLEDADDWGYEAALPYLMVGPAGVDEAALGPGAIGTAVQ